MMRFKAFAKLLSLPALLAAALVTAPMSHAAPAGKSGQIGLMCTWVAFNTEKESFLIDPDSREIYWINQNKLVKVHQFNAGRLVFDGLKTQLTASPVQTAKDVGLRFSIDRITGDMHVAIAGETGQYMRERGRDGKGRCFVTRAF